MNQDDQRKSGNLPFSRCLPRTIPRAAVNNVMRCGIDVYADFRQLHNRDSETQPVVQAKRAAQRNGRWLRQVGCPNGRGDDRTEVAPSGPWTEVKEWQFAGPRQKAPPFFAQWHPHAGHPGTVPFASGGDCPTGVRPAPYATATGITDDLRSVAKARNQRSHIRSDHAARSIPSRARGA